MKLSIARKANKKEESKCGYGRGIKAQSDKKEEDKSAKGNGK